MGATTVPALERALGQLKPLSSPAALETPSGLCIKTRKNSTSGPGKCRLAAMARPRLVAVRALPRRATVPVAPKLGPPPEV